MSSSPPGPIPNLLFVEIGFGVDQHGQNAVKAAVRAVKDAISFNSVPAVSKLVPGGRDGMRVHVRLAVPRGYVAAVEG
eukprot:CAMPEP_0174900476 /NCGR_PEP_ID=MMETSP0167-20121228/31383_1 /TAXON_ID=38298 /ORGANISM="Rhodella maculata, Strain CCMP736" /LENGTH=77 /DNA_ID=CAMNT_0016141863 /DNA_START=140 /DNA_END=369 /DNA_ORIENTATION=+